MINPRNISETPDRWVVVKIVNNQDTPFYKVFATWVGGYLDGDRWKLNSGIKSVESDDDYYYFIGHSGSCYKCRKKGYGTASSYGEGVLQDMIENAYKANSTVNVLSEGTEWKELLNQKEMKKEIKNEYPLLDKDDVCRLMELSYEMGKKGERYSLWELYLSYINQK